jgi:hypothetical protein
MKYRKFFPGDLKILSNQQLAGKPYLGRLEQLVEVVLLFRHPSRFLAYCHRHDINYLSDEGSKVFDEGFLHLSLP